MFTVLKIKGVFITIFRNALTESFPFCSIFCCLEKNDVMAQEDNFAPGPMMSLGGPACTVQVTVPVSQSSSPTSYKPGV